MALKSLRILHVNTSDLAGGSEQVSRQLSEAERARGYDSRLAVGKRRTSDPNVIEFPRDPGSLRWTNRVARRWYTRLQPYAGRVRGIGRLRQALLAWSSWPEIERQLGHEVFDYPASRRLLQLSPQTPDVVHAHNLHIDYFDLTYLPRLSHAKPLILTLHDQWTMTGHCGYSYNCERWKTGCGHCPDLYSYPAIAADATDFNWRRKRDLFARSRLHVATPTEWLMRQVEQSILAPGVREARVIHLGINTNTFRPADKQQARRALGIPANAAVILFAANYVKKNPRKDYALIRAAVTRLAGEPNPQPLLLIGLGEQGAERSVERIGRAEFWIVPFERDQTVVANYQQAADVYAHAARADNQPLTVLEALACGTPVVATNVGGVSELVRDGQHGFLVGAGDVAAMATRLGQILADADLRLAFSMQAAAFIRAQYDLADTVTRYLDWYAALADLHG